MFLLGICLNYYWALFANVFIKNINIDFTFFLYIYFWIIQFTIIHGGARYYLYLEDPLLSAPRGPERSNSANAYNNYLPLTNAVRCTSTNDNIWTKFVCRYLFGQLTPAIKKSVHFTQKVSFLLVKYVRL